MPVPFALLAAALPGAINLGQSLLNKPKEEDFRPNTAGMERFRAYLRGRTASSEVAHQALQPQLSAIGQQTRQTERKIQSAVGRGDLSASEEAQLQISQGQVASEVAQEAGEAAFEAQRQENRRVGQQVAQIEANIAQHKEQAKIDYERATKQHRQQVTGAALQLGAGVASAGISDILTKQATSGAAFDALKASGLGEGFESASDLAKASVDAGFTNPQQYVQMLANQQKVTQSFSQFGKDEISAAAQKLYGTDQFDIGKDLSLGGAQDLMKELGTGRTNAVIQASKDISENVITDISQIPTNLPDKTRIQLASQLSQQKASLADPVDRAIGNAIQTQDKAGLVKIMNQPNISERDYKTALNAHSSITNAEIKAKDKLLDEMAEKAEIKPADKVKMGKFTTRAIELEGKLELDLLNLKRKGLKVGDGYAGSELLNDVVKLKGKTNVTPKELEDLSTKVNKWIESLDLEKTGLLSAFGDIETFEEGIPKGVGVKRKLKSEYSNLIKQIADNNVVLTPEQLSLMYSLD